jgi:hypothetical protein
MKQLIKTSRLVQQIILLPCFVSILYSCGQSAVSSSKETGDKNNMTSNEERKQKLKADVLKFLKHEIIDQEGTGMAAITYILPEDWTVQDKLYWEYRDPTIPIRYQGIYQNSTSKMSIQYYPAVRASWNTGPSGTTGYRPPSDVVSGIKDLIRQERSGKNIQYTDQKNLSNNPGTNYQGGVQANSLSQAGAVRIEYEENGEPFEEEFYGQLDLTDVTTPSVMGNMETIIWGITNLHSEKAPKGKLDECRKIAQAVQSSVQITKPFFNRLSQVVQLLSNQVYQQIYQAGQISRIISETNDQMIANIDASYQQAQQISEKANDNFSNYMRGVDRYSDGDSQIQLPSGYNNAWVNDKGEYILSNTQGWDPNTELNGNWKLLQKN